MLDYSVVTVCVKYDDFLFWSIVLNKHHLRNWLIVTNELDYKTILLCEYHNIDYITTNSFFENNARFNKFAGVNEALKHINTDWVLFLDADIIIPQNINRVLDNLKLKEDEIYGTDRLNLTGPDELLKYLKDRNNIVKDNWLVDFSDYSVGARICQFYGGEEDNGEFKGWTPLGFFQLANKKYFKEYPQKEDSADHCDLVFAKKYEREKRILIPELLCAHIDSEESWGANWNGRITKQFKI